MVKKILGRKAYGSIGHLPQSRMGPSDHCVPDGYARICFDSPRKGDTIIVQEKLDGSCVSVAKVDGILHALGRAGWPACTSPYKQHQLFHWWVDENYQRFDELLQEGERVVGEWLAQAHGTRYKLWHEPFVAFDIMQGDTRLVYEDFTQRIGARFVIPMCLHCGPNGCPLEWAIAALGEYGWHGSIDPVEGVVYRVEREGRVDFLTKFVRPDKVDGCFLPEVSGEPPIWNWSQ